MTPTSSVAPLTKTAEVPCTRERAFELFTRDMSMWWPLSTHSVGGTPSSRVEMNGALGGDIVETLPDGASAIWGTVDVWEPPARVAFTWHPGGDPKDATHVDVTFSATDSGRATVVTLVHRGWSARPDGEQARQNYDTGWDYVLGRFCSAASPDRLTDDRSRRMA